MIHKMRLHNEPFELIANGTKTFELRLNDEKRRNITNAIHANTTVYKLYILYFCL